MKSIVVLLSAAVAMAVPVHANAEDIAGSIMLSVSEAPVEATEGVLDRETIIAIHELRADRGVVLLERAGPGAVSSQAGAALVAIHAGDRAHLYCDINSRRALTGGFVPCFEDRDSDGRLETRYLASTRMEIPSVFLILAAPDSITPAAYRIAEANERPAVRLGIDPCAVGRRPTFRFAISTDAENWTGGGRCQTAEQMSGNSGIGLTVENTGDDLTYRVTQPLAPGSEVLLFPSPG